MNKTTRLIVLLATILFFAAGIACAVSGWTIAGIQIAGIEPTNAAKKDYEVQKYANLVSYDAALKLAVDTKEADLELAEDNKTAALELAGDNLEAIALADKEYTTAVEDAEKDYADAVELAELTYRIANESARLDFEFDLAELKDDKKTALISVFVFDSSYGLKQTSKTVITNGATPIDDVQVETSFRNPGLTTVGNLIVSSFVFLLLGTAGIITYVIFKDAKEKKEDKTA